MYTLLQEGGGTVEAEKMEVYAARAVEQYRQQEAEARRQRQAEGIAAAKARGVRFGRPVCQPHADFALVVEEWENKRMTLNSALRLCGMSKATFFRRLKGYRRECGIEK